MSGHKGGGLFLLLWARNPDVNQIIGAFVSVYNKAYCGSHADHWDVSKEDWYRFAFLGDRVLNLVVSQALFTRRETSLNKGMMTRILSGIVSNSALAAHCSENGISVDPLVPVSVDLQKKGGERITGTAFEAFIGALYCEFGLDDVSSFITSLFGEEIQRLEMYANAKGDLQEYLNREKKPSPDYSRITKGGPEHEPRFTCSMRLDDNREFAGTGPTKRDAQQAAARAALDAIRKE
jgi:ribonuclease-3